MIVASLASAFYTSPARALHDPAESFVTDGVRRIAEVIARPPVVPQGANYAGGGSQNNENPMALEGEDPPPQQIIAPPPPPIPVPGIDVWTDRQYVYGPDYVDEFLWQVPTADMPVAYMLQDGNYNVMCLVDGTGTVLTQQSFEPYGTVATYEKFDNHAVNRVGHQGLFFERFDGTYADPTLSTESDGFYYNRNRFYAPVNGRFITRDPNETGMPILTAMAMNGESASIFFGALNGQSLYGDGMNLYQYVGSNPVNRLDAAGTDFSLGGMLTTVGTGAYVAANVASYGLDAYNYFKMFRDGVQFQQILLVMAFDGAMNWTGGKAFELAFKGLTKLAKLTTSTAIASARVAITHEAGEWLSKGARNVHVYIGWADDGAKAVYVGISNDVARRQTEHGARFLLKQITTSPLTRNEAKAIEQLIMDTNGIAKNGGKFVNEINSIAIKNDMYDAAKMWAIEYVQKHGIDIAY